MNSKKSRERSSRQVDGESPKPKGKRWIRRVLIGLFVFLFVWLASDFGYSRYVQTQISRWESNISRDDNGVRLGCDSFTLNNGDRAILFVHGFNETPQIWYKMAPNLAERGFTCRGLRLPGFGEPIEEYRKSNHEAWLKAIDEEIKSLQEKHTMIIVVAHSLGGAVTVQQLLQEPGCVDGVVLLAPAIDTASVRSPFLTTRFWHEFSKWTLPFSQTAMSPFEYDAKDPKEQQVKLRNKFSPRSVVNSMYHLIDENRDRAGEIKTPARFFVSPDDQVVDTATVKNFYQAWGAENKSLTELDNSGHAIPIDFDWKDVADEVEAFANELAEGVR